MVNLRDRALQFMERPLPPGIPDTESQTHDFIRRYIQGGPWDDPSLQEDGRLFYTILRTGVEAEGFGPEALLYYHECGEILKSILIEIYGPDSAEPIEDIG